MAFTSTWTKTLIPTTTFRLPLHHNFYPYTYFYHGPILEPDRTNSPTDPTLSLNPDLMPTPTPTLTPTTTQTPRPTSIQTLIGLFPGPRCKQRSEIDPASTKS